VAEAEAENGTGLALGEYLKSVRESRGLQLDEVARVTKIGKSYLVAIEQGDFDKLPNAAYIKGFLRLYAGFLSLSGDEVVARYERGLPQASTPQVEPAPERPGLELVEKAKLGGHGRWVIPALLLALVILAALFLPDREEKPTVRPVPPPPAVQPAAPPVSAVLPQRSSATFPGVTPVPGDNLPSTGAPAGDRQTGIILRLRFNQDSWLSITIDDSISQRYDLKAGDIIEWKGARLFVLDIGDGGAVEAEFNGRQLKTLGEAGKPAHIELKGE
jgi:cytoskeleton protein RodZ